MAKNEARNFGQVIRERRRQLNLTQEEVSHRIAASTPYVGHLESGKRHPSYEVVIQLADVLLLDRWQLWLDANPQLVDLVPTQKQDGDKSAWVKFCENTVRRIHRISKREMETLREAKFLGDADFIYILYTIRQASGAYTALAKPARGRV